MTTRQAGMVQRPDWKSANPSRRRASPGSPAIKSLVFIAEFRDGGSKRCRVYRRVANQLRFDLREHSQQAIRLN
jgi:hypothetical protein